jgi:hypothetical protein
MAKEVCQFSLFDSRLLVTSIHRTVYVGAAASIAFLQTVRRVVAGQIGPSNFSHSIDSEKMLEVETPEATDDIMGITVEQKLQFLQCYFSVVRIDLATLTVVEATDSARRKHLLISSILQNSVIA